MAKSNLVLFNEFRKQKLELLEAKKIPPQDFANNTFGYISKYHIKPSGSKPKNRNQLLINYFYWITFIERKVFLEERLIEVGLGSQEQLIQAIKIYLKRRDKSVEKLLVDFKEKPKSIRLISDQIVELTLSDDIILFAHREVLEELGYSFSLKENPLLPIYSHKFVLKYF